MSNLGHQEIKCNVASCRYNENTEYCTLSNIVVGNDDTSHEAKTKKETECSSFDPQ